MTLHTVSFGGGVQTVALAILNARGDVPDPARDLVMADTGDEHPATYAYLRDHFQPWAERAGMRLHVARAPLADSLYAYAWRYRLVPSIQTRWCTEKFKIAVINRWLRQNGATSSDPADSQIGISAEESHRAIDRRPRRYRTHRWPLVELRLTRRDCLAIISEAGLPPPPKSACWYCPFQSSTNWRRLADEHPELAERALALEVRARDRRRQEYIGPHGPLINLLRGGVQLPLLAAADAQLENDASCTAGTCFV